MATSHSHRTFMYGNQSMQKAASHWLKCHILNLCLSLCALRLFRILSLTHPNCLAYGDCQGTELLVLSELTHLLISSRLLKPSWYFTNLRHKIFHIIYSQLWTQVLQKTHGLWETGGISRFQGFIPLSALGGYKARITFTYTVICKYIILTIHWKYLMYKYRNTNDLLKSLICKYRNTNDSLQIFNLHSHTQ